MTSLSSHPNVHTVHPHHDQVDHEVDHDGQQLHDSLNAHSHDPHEEVTEDDGNYDDEHEQAHPDHGFTVKHEAQEYVYVKDERDLNEIDDGCSTVIPVLSRSL